MGEVAGAVAGAVVHTSPGWGPSSYILLGILSLIGVIVGAVLKALPQMGKLRLERDDSLREDLLKELSLLREEARADRRECDERLAKASARIRDLENEVSGLNRRLLDLSQRSGIPIDLVPPAPTDMIHTLRRLEPPTA